MWLCDCCCLVNRFLDKLLLKLLIKLLKSARCWAGLWCLFDWFLLSELVIWCTLITINQSLKQGRDSPKPGGSRDQGRREGGGGTSAVGGFHLQQTASFLNGLPPDFYGKHLSHTPVLIYQQAFNIIACKFWWHLFISMLCIRSWRLEWGCHAQPSKILLLNPV